MRQLFRLISAALILVGSCSSEPPISVGPELDVSDRPGAGEDAGDAGVPDGEGSDISDHGPGAPDPGGLDELPEPDDVADTVEPEDVLDVFVCPAGQPVKCEEPPSCWAPGIDCSTVHQNPDGELDACTTGFDAFVDATGTLVCCGGEQPAWCPANEAGYGGGCWPAGSDCNALLQCGKGWDLCSTEQTGYCNGEGTATCCGPGAHAWCGPNGEHGGFCAPEGSDCSTAIQCLDSAWLVCPQGQSSHCTADAALECCTDLDPMWCDPNAEIGFGGGCFAEGIDCSTLTPDGQGGFDACLATQYTGLDAAGKLKCCTSTITCPVGSGLQSDYDGSECLPFGTSCDTLAAKPDGGWAYCSEDVVSFGLADDGTLLCCGGDTPKLCEAGVKVPDGKKGQEWSMAAFPPKEECSSQCTLGTTCSKIGGVVAQCRQPGTLCNQCVADPYAFKVPFAGGCYPADFDCSRIYHCGDMFQVCEWSSCYCWNGSLSYPWDPNLPPPPW